MHRHLQAAPEQRQTNYGKNKETNPAIHSNCVWV
jgi:hypothetical protein